MAVKIEKVSYKGFDDCIRMSNDTVDLIITTQVGPRVLLYGFIHGDNVFCNVEEQMGKTGENQWNIYGGHRLWHSRRIPVAPMYRTTSHRVLHKGKFRLLKPTCGTVGSSEKRHSDNSGRNRFKGDIVPYFDQ